MAVQVRLFLVHVTLGQDRGGVRVPSPLPTETRASLASAGFHVHATRPPPPSPQRTPALHSPAPRQCARQAPSSPPPPTPKWRLAASGPSNPTSIFLCSLAMRSSNSRGPSGRARRRSRRGWRGCGGRSRRTWSWPSRSARLTCPPPRRPAPATGAGGTAAGALVQKEKARVCLYARTHARTVAPVSRGDAWPPLFRQGLAGQRASGSGGSPVP